MSPRGPGGSPSDLVPGDPGGVEALAGRLRVYAEGAAAGAARLRAIDSGAWEGEAADAFRAVIDEIPAKLERGAGAFAEAAAALGAYAATLRSAQEVATRVVGLLGEADQHSAAWSFQREAYTAALGQGEAVAATLGPPPSVMDPGAAQRQEALRLLEGARAEVDSAARRSAARLRDAAAVAPDEPGLLSKIWHGVSEFGAGAWEATYGMARFAFTLSPLYLMVDPEGYVENLVGLGQGVVYGVTHPVEFAKAVADWDTWVENPARALGHLVPDLLLAVGTGGAGVWARRAGIEAKALSKLSRSQRPARIAHLAEASAQRYLSRLEQSVPGAHFLARHGAQTTLEQQFRRATTGMTPDGVQHIPRNASRFLTHRDQLEVIQRAQDDPPADWRPRWSTSSWIGCSAKAPPLLPALGPRQPADGEAGPALGAVVPPRLAGERFP